jgi:integrase
MSKAQAQTELAAIVEPINAQEAGRNPNWELGGFVETVFLPFYRRKWKRSTAMTTEARMQQHITWEFAKRPLCSFTRDELQDFLEKKGASGLSASVLKHLRWDLRQIFEMAVTEGHLPRNPAHLLFVPRSAASAPKLIMTLEEVNICLKSLATRERLIVKLAILAGMRPGEILGLRWKAVGDGHCDVRIRVYRGDIDTPKTHHSLRNVALSESVIGDFAAWRQLCPDTRPEAWVFASERNDTPLWRDSLWRRCIQPCLEKVGLEWANFQVMRRTHSSLMNELMVDPKLVADQLGHTVHVNQNVYTKAALHRRQKAVKLLDEALAESLMDPNGATGRKKKP